MTWEYLFPGLEVPKGVYLLGRYDVWDHSDRMTLPFQYGLRHHEDTSPNNIALWKMVFGYLDVDKVFERGLLLMEYEERQNAKFCKAYAFETKLIAGEGFEAPEFECRAICANRGFTNSKLFDSVYDPEKHDLMITFCRLKPPAHKWTVSLYSTKSEIDCGAIARCFGGGGHKGAAGFQCIDLPFTV